MRLEISRQICAKSSNIRLQENLYSWSEVVPRGRTDITMLIVAFRNFANASENYEYYRLSVSVVMRSKA